MIQLCIKHDCVKLSNLNTPFIETYLLEILLILKQSRYAIAKPSDQQLVSSYMDGDTVSLEALVERHKTRIFTFIISKVRNHDLAEDIFQDTFFKVIKSLQKGKYNEEGKFLPCNAYCS